MRLLGLLVLLALAFIIIRMAKRSTGGAVGAQRCPHCGHQIPAIGSYCPICGKPTV